MQDKIVVGARWTWLAAGSEGMSQGRTSEEANSASVGVTLFATSRFVEGGSLRKSYLSNDIAAADICRRERGRSLAHPEATSFSRPSLNHSNPKGLKSEVAT